MQTEQIEEGKWYRLTAKERIVCCDCGLAHDVTLKRIDGKLYARWRRNDRSSAATRKSGKYPMKAKP